LVKQSRILKKLSKEKEMSETADFNPGHWKGHDFKSARKAYDVHVDRSYGDAVKAKKTLKDVLPPNITTDSPAPLVILCDVTGSMGDWPATIFSKLPYLELEAQEYLGDKMEICWGAVGDHTCSDKYPLQMRQFVKGTELKEELKKLIVEGGGGGGARESYEMAALYCAKNISMPKAVKPILIVIGDEGFYENINKADAKQYALVNLKARVQSKEVFTELQRKFSVYLIRKPYGWSGVDSTSASDRTIHAQWAKVLGDDRVVMLPKADRVVDVIFGLLARETDRVEYFEDELKGRQKPGQVKTVMKALETVHELTPNSKKLLRSGKSQMHKKGDGKKTKSLL
jgi:hypothetical protein